MTPPIDYFTVQKLAEKLGCSQDDVLHQVETYRLAPAFNFQLVVCGPQYCDDGGLWIPYLDNEEKGVVGLPIFYSGKFQLPPDEVRSRWQLGAYPLSQKWKGQLMGAAFPLTEKWELYGEWKEQMQGKKCRIVPVYSFEVTTADFFFLRDEVERFESEYCGKATPDDKPDKQQNDETDSVADEPQTPQEYVSELKRNRENEHVIAALLKGKFPVLQAYEGMKLIDPERVTLWEDSSSKQGRPKEWFNYRVKKGEKILKERANTSMS